MFNKKSSYNLFHINNNNVEKKSICNYISWFVFFSFVVGNVFVYYDCILYNNNFTFLTTLYLRNRDHNPSFDECAGKYIFIQNLPTQLNEEILKDCTTLNMGLHSLCDALENSGFGPLVNNSDYFGQSGWYKTYQYSIDVIFHNKMKHYKCLTKNSSKAEAVFVPFYAGLDAGHYLWDKDVTLKDVASTQLAEYLRKTPEWAKTEGRDHFLVTGRASWDFSRNNYTCNMGQYCWGNNLLSLPEIEHMTTIVYERNVYSKGLEITVPYPTYFHPSSEKQVVDWQNKMRGQTRPYLFSFAGARRPDLPYTLRDEIIGQCLGSKKYCKFLRCDDLVKNCDKVENVPKLFGESVFCMQPAGDTYTRRSAFDSIIAGCIPVFFYSASAYDQYFWHLPNNYTTYSVFITAEDIKKGVSIEKRLLQFSEEEILSMREEVIRLIPKVIYAHPKSELGNLEDAFDVTVKQVLKQIQEVILGFPKLKQVPWSKP